MPREQVARYLETARSARGDGKLRHAVETLDHAWKGLDDRDSRAAQALGEEGVRLGLALEAAGAPLAALSEYLRSFESSRAAPAREGISRGVKRYAEWRPKAQDVTGGTTIKAGATGSLWLGLGARGRIVVLDGGITAESVAPARRALERAGTDVQWLVIDMKQLGYVGSSGLAAMVKVAEDLNQKGGGIVLFDVASALMVLIDTLGLGRYFSPVQTLEAALGKVHERRQGSGQGPKQTG